MLAQGFLRVKGQAKITKCYFLWVGRINMQSLSGHYLMRQKVPMVFFTSFSLSRYCCLRFCRNKFGLILAQGYFKGQRSRLFTNCNFLWLCVICNHWVATIWCAIKYPRCLYFFGFSKCCCLQFCRNKFGLLLVQGYFKGQRSRIYHKLQLFMTLCDMQSSSGNYSMRHQVPMVFLLLLIYLSAVTCISEERNLGQCWRKDILRVKGQV